MPKSKKAKFKYKVGQVVNFTYYDGTPYVGTIVERQYKGQNADWMDTLYDMCEYTLHVPDNSGRYQRGYMAYPSLTENRINQVQQITTQSFLSDEVTSVNSSTVATGVPITNSVASELDEAIAQQRKFLSK